jgi:hypothetical protein
LCAHVFSLYKEKENTEMTESMMPSFDPSAFMADEQPAPVLVTGKVTKRKRARAAEPYSKPVDEELMALRKKAESMCGSYEQFKIVKRYKKERLQDWVNQHEFDRDSQLRANVFDFFHAGYARALDFVTQGNGHVEQCIKNDLSLRTAIEDEGRDFVKYLSNKAKLLMLSVSDVASGKMEQGLLTKSTAVHIEEIQQDDDGEHEEEAGEDNNSSAWGFRNFFGSEARTDEEEVLSVPEGAENMQITSDAISSYTEGQATCDVDLRTEKKKKNTPDSEVIEE